MVAGCEEGAAIKLVGTPSSKAVQMAARNEVDFGSVGVVIL